MAELGAIVAVDSITPETRIDAGAEQRGQESTGQADLMKNLGRPDAGIEIAHAAD